MLSSLLMIIHMDLIQFLKPHVYNMVWFESMKVEAIQRHKYTSENGEWILP